MTVSELRERYREELAADPTSYRAQLLSEEGTLANAIRDHTLDPLEHFEDYEQACRDRGLTAFGWESSTQTKRMHFLYSIMDGLMRDYRQMTEDEIEVILWYPGPSFVFESGLEYLRQRCFGDLRKDRNRFDTTTHVPVSSEVKGTVARDVYNHYFVEDTHLRASAAQAVAARRAGEHMRAEGQKLLEKDQDAEWRNLAESQYSGRQVTEMMMAMKPHVKAHLKGQIVHNKMHNVAEKRYLRAAGSTNDQHVYAQLDLDSEGESSSINGEEPRLLQPKRNQIKKKNTLT